jgi:hypothetical protein
MTMSFWSRLFLSLIGTLGAIAAIAYGVVELGTTPPPKRFITSTFEFDLAPGWSCALEGTEYICTVGTRPFEVICVIAMKYRNAQDTLDVYEEHVKQPRPAMGTQTLSQVLSVERRWLGGHEWVDARHKDSEITGYFTHYLATTTSHLGVLVTFTALESKYEQRKAELDRMIESLTIHQRHSASTMKGRPRHCGPRSSSSQASDCHIAESVVSIGEDQVLTR